MPASPSTAATPIHLWIIGGLTLVWNAFGALDYLMTQFRVDAYMAQFTPEQLTYFYNFPAWADAAWALGVWGSVAGSAGLLLRRAWAQWGFAISIAGLAGSSSYTLLMTDGAAIMGGTGIIVFSVVIWCVTIALYLYARRMATRGVLR